MGDQIEERIPSISLDELDLLLIEQLRKDARQPVTALARVVGANRETVRYRLSRLISQGVVTIVCTSHIQPLGYQFMLLIGVRARSGTIDTLARQLAELPSVLAVSLVASHYNIMMWAFVRNQSDLTHFITEELANISNAVSIEIMHAFNVIKEFWVHPKGKEHLANSHLKGELSDFDMSIIKAMQQSPRQTITELAKTIGCSRAVASGRLEKLIGDGTIGFWPFVDQTILGYNYWVVMLIQTEPDKVSAVANELAVLDAMLHVSLITGQWQIYAIVQFKNSRYMSDFMSETMDSIPGIIKSEVIPLGKNLKFSIKLVDWI